MTVIIWVASIKHSKKWTASVKNSGLGFDNDSYYTLGYGKRETQYIGGFRIIDDKNTKASEDRVFCVEPAVKFPTSGTVEGYSSTSEAPTTSDGYHWNVAGDEEHLKLIVDTNPLGFKMWAMRNIDLVEVKKPVSLRNEMKEIVEKAREKYL